MNIDRFLLHYRFFERQVDNPTSKDIIDKEVNALIKKYGGFSIEKGLFKIHTSLTSHKWTDIVLDIYPKYKDKIIIFGFDWMGRQFAKKIDADFIFMFDIVTGKDYELEVSLAEFFNTDLVDYADVSLAIDSFMEWLLKTSSKLDFDFVVGLKTPLFLGGQDELSNYEVSDMEVMWEINKQLLDKIN